MEKEGNNGEREYSCTAKQHYWGCLSRRGLLFSAMLGLKVSVSSFSTSLPMGGQWLAAPLEAAIKGSCCRHYLTRSGQRRRSIDRPSCEWNGRHTVHLLITIECCKTSKQTAKCQCLSYFIELMIHCRRVTVWCYAAARHSSVCPSGTTVFSFHLFQTQCVSIYRLGNVRRAVTLFTLALVLCSCCSCRSAHSTAVSCP